MPQNFTFFYPKGSFTNYVYRFLAFFDPPHTGIFDLKIIANNAILLVISISTTFALLGSSKVSNEAKNFKELEFLGLSR